MVRNQASFEELRENVSRERKIIEELKRLSSYLKNLKDTEEKKMVFDHMDSLKNSLKRVNREVLENVEKNIFNKTFKKIPYYKPASVSANKNTEYTNQRHTFTCHIFFSYTSQKKIYCIWLGKN